MLSQKVFTAAASSVLCLSAGAAAAAPADDLVCKDAAAQGKLWLRRVLMPWRNLPVRWAEIMSVWKR